MMRPEQRAKFNDNDNINRVLQKYPRLKADELFKP